MQAKQRSLHGAGIGGTVAVLLVLTCVGSLSSLMNMGSGHINSPETALNPEDVLLRDAKLDFTWDKEGFGNVMIANFLITNPTQYRFKDFEIKCTHKAPSGTVIDSNTRTIYEIVEPNSTKAISINMGFIHSQAEKSRCAITKVVVVR
jgi:5-keto 4-deoxyuronate isomerase